MCPEMAGFFGFCNEQKTNFVFLVFFHFPMSRPFIFISFIFLTFVLFSAGVRLHLRLNPIRNKRAKRKRKTEAENTTLSSTKATKEEKKIVPAVVLGRPSWTPFFPYLYILIGHQQELNEASYQRLVPDIYTVHTYAIPFLSMCVCACAWMIGPC